MCIRDRQWAGGVDYIVNTPLAAPAAGNQYCYINMFSPGVTGGIYQDVGALSANTVYTLTVAIGSRHDRNNSPGIISLVNGVNNAGTLLASGGGLSATQNTWQDYSVTFTNGASANGDLTIVLSVIGNGTTIQADFDNVRLTKTSLVLTAPTFGAPRFTGGNLVLTGTNGTPGSSYSVLTSTNLAAPLAAWTTNITGVVDGSGIISNAVPVSPSVPSRFFRLKEP